MVARRRVGREREGVHRGKRRSSRGGECVGRREGWELEGAHLEHQGAHVWSRAHPLSPRERFLHKLFERRRVGRERGGVRVEGVAHRVAEDPLGAAKDGSVKMLIVASAAHRVAEGVFGAAKDGSVKVFIVAKDLAFHRGKRRSSRGGRTGA